MGNLDTEGLARARSKETDQQKGGRSGTKVAVNKFSKQTKSNPKKGGGINRPLAGKA